MTKLGKFSVAIVIIVLLAGFAFFLQGDREVAYKPAPVVNSSIKGCYVAKLAKDVYTLEISSEDKGNFAGVIAYNNFEKDSSSGVFAGKFSDGILLGNHSFDSEGMHSNRQLIFKKFGDNFVQGFGAVKSAGDTETFVDISKVVYDPKTTFVKDADCTQNFTAQNGSLSFDYHSFFKVNPGFSVPGTEWQLNTNTKGVLLATLYVPRGYMPKTNFSDAKLTVGRSSDVSATKNCLLDNPGMNAKGEVATVSGFPFTKFKFSGAAAGNYYNTTSYKGIIGRDCYVVEYTIHSTNVSAYSPDQGIREFDKVKLTNDLEAIMKSLKFTLASD